MFKAWDLFSCEPSAESDDEIVVREFSFNLTIRDDHFSFERIDLSNFSLDEVHSSAQHSVAEIQGDVLLLALTERQPHERGIKQIAAA